MRSATPPIRVLVLAAILAAAAAQEARPAPRRSGDEDRAVAGASLPWAMPSAESLRTSRRKVFAHYFTPFPLSSDNADAAGDYYAKQLLTADGENGKHAAYGGFLRERPLPRAPRREADWAMADLQHEVRCAHEAALDGFVVDLLYADDADGRVRRLMDAAQAVDPAFRIMLMPDMTAAFRAAPERLVPTVRALGAHPSAFRLDDGRLVVSPFNAQERPPEWWHQAMDELSRGGTPAAFVPLFQGWRRFAADYAPISHGFSDWGERSPAAGERVAAGIAEAKGHVAVWMQTVAPQDVRPKEGVYSESGGSLAYRRHWEGAITGGADWVQAVTWNDYSECTEIAPSSGIGHAFYDLTAYYAAWFKTGRAPTIRRDGLLGFHRVQRTDVRLLRQAHPWTCREAPLDEVDLVAFLKAPGELEITSGGETTRAAVAAGLVALRAPLRVGRQSFRLVRGGREIIAMKSPWEVVAEADFQDMLYRAVVSYRPQGGLVAAVDE